MQKEELCLIGYTDNVDLRLSEHNAGRAHNNIYAMRVSNLYQF